ncbi:hypothetical protein HX866_27065 [Pseudomonas gingeri]|uniref:hypothetical protein n=1 Tax=Pseudomonas gingeri TaxID=117681 RepID=UPI0015A145D1|nr:hypothetical protein [Pseudomonas gingeri]NWA28555.1 hypothetical protein [Pseudomonas gingeri]
MTVPTRADIVAEAERGTLLDAIFRNFWGCSYQDYDALTDVLADAHNDGEVELLNVLEPCALDLFHGHVREHGRQIYGRLLGKLNTPAASILFAFDALYEADNVGSVVATDALGVWCSVSPERPLELLKLIDDEFPSAAKYHSLAIAIRCGLRVDSAYFSDRAYEFLVSGSELQRIDVIRALISVSFVENDEWIRVLGVFQSSLTRETSEEVRSALLKTALSWFQSAPVVHAETIHDLVTQATAPTSSKVAREVAYALAFNFKGFDITVRESLLSVLYSINPDVDTLNLIDLALTHFIEEGSAEHARNYIETLVLRDGKKFSFSHFDSVIQGLRDDKPKQLDEWVVSWLMSGEYALCRELNDGLFDGEDEHRFQIDFTQFRLAELDYGFVARKAIAAFFSKPMNIATLMVSLGRSASFAQINELRGLLFDPVLINYPSLAEKYLRSVADDKEDKASPMVRHALARLDDYLSGIEKIGFVPEFQPSERERQIEWQLRSDSMADAMRKGTKHSFLADFVSHRVLLYGNGMVSWVKDLSASVQQGGRPSLPLRRIEVELKTYSRQFELPREEILDPAGLRSTLLNFKLERRSQ